MARPIKKVKTRLEKLIRKIWKDTQKGRIIAMEEQAAVIAAIILTLNHFEEEDRLHNTIHSRIFAKTYLANDIIAQKDFNSRTLLFETAMEIHLNHNGYSIISSPVKTESKPNKRNKKSATEKTRDKLADEVGISVRTLKDNTDMYMKCFENKLNSIISYYSMYK